MRRRAFLEALGITTVGAAIADHTPAAAFFVPGSSADEPMTPDDIARAFHAAWTTWPMKPSRLAVERDAGLGERYDRLCRERYAAFKTIGFFTLDYDEWAADGKARTS